MSLRASNTSSGRSTTSSRQHHHRPPQQAPATTPTAKHPPTPNNRLIFIKDVPAYLARRTVPALLRTTYGATHMTNVHPDAALTTFVVSFASAAEARRARRGLDGMRLEGVVLWVEGYERRRSRRMKGEEEEDEEEDDEEKDEGEEEEGGKVPSCTSAEFPALPGAMRSRAEGQEEEEDDDKEKEEKEEDEEHNSAPNPLPTTIAAAAAAVAAPATNTPAPSGLLQHVITYRDISDTTRRIQFVHQRDCVFCARRAWRALSEGEMAARFDEEYGVL